MTKSGIGNLGEKQAGCNDLKAHLIAPSDNSRKHHFLYKNVASIALAELE
jgi:hypothetical protein